MVKRGDRSERLKWRTRDTLGHQGFEHAAAVTSAAAAALGDNFLVDGLTEKKIVQKLCQGATVRLTGMNGKDVALPAIAKAALSLIMLLKGGHYPIVLVVDREKRTQSSLDMEAELKSLLVKAGVPDGDVIIACPDRMIENWMLGDERYFEEIYDIKLPATCEGLHGKREIRRLMMTKKVTYHEVSLGVDLFCNIDPSRVAASSASFDRFVRRINPFCPWMRRSAA